jgi:hypothetical protein
VNFYLGGSLKFFLFFGEAVEVILFVYIVHHCSIHYIVFECTFPWKDKGYVGTAFLVTNFSTQCSLIELENPHHQFTG